MASVRMSTRTRKRRIQPVPAAARFLGTSTPASLREVVPKTVPRIMQRRQIMWTAMRFSLFVQVLIVGMKRQLGCGLVWCGDYGLLGCRVRERYVDLHFVDDTDWDYC